MESSRRTTGMGTLEATEVNKHMRHPARGHERQNWRDKAILERKSHLGKRGNPARYARGDTYIPHLIKMLCNLAMSLIIPSLQNSCNQILAQTKLITLKTETKLVSCLLFRLPSCDYFMSVVRIFLCILCLKICRVVV
jgi:hypothetical protein